MGQWIIREFGRCAEPRTPSSLDALGFRKFTISVLFLSQLRVCVGQNAMRVDGVPPPGGVNSAMLALLMIETLVSDCKYIRLMYLPR